MTDEQQHRKIAEEAVKAAPTSTRGRFIILLCVIIAIAFALVAITAIVVAYSAKKQEANAGKDLANQVQKVCTDRKVAAKFPNIKNLCSNANKVAQGQSIPGPPGPTGPAGPTPSELAIESAVNLYCTSIGGCIRGPSSTQVAAAVATYCNDRGECRGEQGKPGKDGTNGIDGINGSQGPQGVQGPPPSSDQIADAVTAYCGQPTLPCKGDKGDKGDPGVVAVDSTNCQPQGGQVISGVTATYDSDTRKILLTCTYASAFIPGP